MGFFDKKKNKSGNNNKTGSPASTKSARSTASSARTPQSNSNSNSNSNWNSNNPQKPKPQQQQQQQQFVRIVGDSKHVTTAMIDDQGRKVTQTTIYKLASTKSAPSTESSARTPQSNSNSNNPPKPKPQQQQQQQQVVKIVGDSKHVTTARIDDQGRKVTQTTITKLTPAELQQAPPPPGSRTPPSPRESYQPPISPMQQKVKQPPAPPQQQEQQQQQQYQQQQQQQPRSSDNSSNMNDMMMKTPPTPLPDTSSSRTATTSPTVVQNITVGDESMATIEVTRELVKRFISDIWNRGEVELIPKVCHSSLRFNGHVGMDRVGHEGFARMVTTVRESLTDYHCEIHSMVVETNKAFCRLRFTGKHTGNLLGYPPTGNTVAWMGASEFTCKNGKILKVWELGDCKSLEDQLKS